MNYLRFAAASLLTLATIVSASTTYGQDALGIASSKSDTDTSIVLVGESNVLVDAITFTDIYDQYGFVGYGVAVFSSTGQFEMLADTSSILESPLAVDMFDADGNSVGSMLIVIVNEPDSATESKKIGEGHAYDKHVLGDNNSNGKEFEKDKVIDGKKFPRDSITTEQQFVDFIKEIIDSPTEKKQSPTQPGKWYYWHDETGTIVIYNPNDGDHGTCFRPTNGKTYYDNQN